jgi:pantetheine-phosphate adenylyltransferase
MKVCIGGTFDILHQGHKTLIDKAFEIAGSQGSVFIGITTEELLKQKNDVKPLDERKMSIKQYLSNKGVLDQAIIQSITDKYGPLLDEDFDVIVVSPETVKTAEEINRKRKKTGKKTVEIIQIPFVLANDNKPISSSRIKKGEIDKEGKILE